MVIQNSGIRKCGREIAAALEPMELLKKQQVGGALGKEVIENGHIIDILIFTLSKGADQKRKPPHPSS